MNIWGNLQLVKHTGYHMDMYLEPKSYIMPNSQEYWLLQSLYISTAHSRIRKRQYEKQFQYNTTRRQCGDVFQICMLPMILRWLKSVQKKKKDEESLARWTTDFFCDICLFIGETILKIMTFAEKDCHWWNMKIVIGVHLQVSSWRWLPQVITEVKVVLANKMLDYTLTQARQHWGFTLFIKFKE